MHLRHRCPDAESWVVLLYDSTFSTTVWRLYGGAKGLAMWYYIQKSWVCGTPKKIQPHVHRSRPWIPGPLTKIVQGWPQLWANSRALIGIFGQSVGPSLAIWANPVQCSFKGEPSDLLECVGRQTEGQPRTHGILASPEDDRRPRLPAAPQSAPTDP